jgi:hypothetical protein
VEGERVKPEALQRIRAAAHEELARAPKLRPWWHDALLMAGINSAVAVACAPLLGLAGFSGNPAPAAIQVAVAVPIALVIVLGAVVAVMPGRAVGLLSALVLVGIAAAAIVTGGSGTWNGRAFPAGGIACMSQELVMATVPTGLAIAVLSRFAYSPLRMLVAALAGGAAGVLALHLRCPIATASHLAVFHVLPWMAAAGIAVFIRSRVRSRSFAP